jgi:hypothetical protein
MPRTSAENEAMRSLVAIIPGSGRSPPPDDLGEHERRLWEQTVSSMPATWFPAACHPLLKCYVRHAHAAELTGQAYIAALLTSPLPDNIETLAARFARETNALCTTATKLRIGARATTRLDVADTQVRSVPARRLWERNPEPTKPTPEPA